MDHDLEFDDLRKAISGFKNLVKEKLAFPIVREALDANKESGKNDFESLSPGLKEKHYYPGISEEEVDEINNTPDISDERLKEIRKVAKSRPENWQLPEDR